MRLRGLLHLFAIALAMGGLAASASMAAPAGEVQAHATLPH